MSHDGDEVVVIDKDPKAFSRLLETFKGRTIAGVGFDRTVECVASGETNHGETGVSWRINKGIAGQFRTISPRGVRT